MDNLITKEEFYNKFDENKVLTDLKKCWDKNSFNFNIKPTREDFKQYLENSLIDLKMNNYIYVITCDETNNSPEIIDINKLKIRVDFKSYNYNVYYADYILPDAFEQLELKN